MTPTLNTAFNLIDLFSQVHGYRPAFIAGVPSLPESEAAPVIPATVKKVTNLYGQPLYGQADLLGHEVFCPITIQVNGTDYQFPFAVIGFSRTKTVISTDMPELNDEVDEIISNRSFQISIKGFLIGQYEQFPDEGLKALNDAFTYNGTVRLKSALSDIFLHGNDNILLLKMDIPEKPKVIGVRDFALTAKSSGIFTLYQS